MTFCEHLSRLHDAEILSVSVNRHQRIVDVRVLLENQDNYMINFQGVASFRITDLILQNIIYGIYIINADNCEEIKATQKIKWVNTLSDGACFVTDERVKDIVDDIRRGDLSICYIIPSFGAEICLIFKKLLMSRSDGSGF